MLDAEMEEKARLRIEKLEQILNIKGDINFSKQ